MSSIFEGREPQAPLRFFEAVSAVPRGSRNEAGIARWLEAFARERGLPVYVDADWNVLITKPGQKGGESSAPVMLQGHTDIVCEKNEGTDFDFEKDGIRLKIEGDRLMAAGTTLGNDDGYALAYMLAVLDSRDLRHPPLECLFTAMEEIGLVGAQRFDYSRITARRMIGMDGGREGFIMIGSAGGMQVALRAPAALEPCAGAGAEIWVRGLMGGHSGAEIDKVRGNANQILGRILWEIARDIPFRLAEVQGGDKDNAIPRESRCVIAAEAGHYAAIAEKVAAVTADIQAELAYSDPGLYTGVQPARPQSCLGAADTARALALMHLLPSGVERMSMAVPGLVGASQNFASVRREGGHLAYVVSIRSAEDSLVKALGDRVCHLGQALGALAERSALYPAYAYNPVSPLRDLAARLWREESGCEPVLQAAHGGTELGIFSGSLPGLDIVTLGPNSGGAHTPEEWVDLKSFGRAYGFLLRILETL